MNSLLSTIPVQELSVHDYREQLMLAILQGDEQLAFNDQLRGLINNDLSVMPKLYNFLTANNLRENWLLVINPFDLSAVMLLCYLSAVGELMEEGELKVRFISLNAADEQSTQCMLFSNDGFQSSLTFDMAAGLENLATPAEVKQAMLEQQYDKRIQTQLLDYLKSKQTT